MTQEQMLNAVEDLGFELIQDLNNGLFVFSLKDTPFEFWIKETGDYMYKFSFLKNDEEFSILGKDIEDKCFYPKGIVNVAKDFKEKALKLNQTLDDLLKENKSFKDINNFYKESKER